MPSNASTRGSADAPLPLPAIDIGVNLLDGMYQGMYHGKQKHAPDLNQVIARAPLYGVLAVIVTAGSLPEAKGALKLVREANIEGLDKGFLFSTVGVHPTRCDELEDGGEEYLNSLLAIANEGKRTGHVVAIGECGLDYDRLKFCSKEVQKKWFERHFELANKTGLPMFLHNRNTSGDFVDMVRRNRHRFSEGVVHSFDGSEEELKQLLQLGMHIGINGCSMKTKENLHVMSKIPLDRLMVETDAPWCEIRPSHAGHHHIQTKFESIKKERYEPSADGKIVTVKGRTEPIHIQQVLEVIAAHRNIDPQMLADQVVSNTKRVFFPKGLPRKMDFSALQRMRGGAGQRTTRTKMLSTGLLAAGHLAGQVMKMSNTPTTFASASPPKQNQRSRPRDTPSISPGSFLYRRLVPWGNVKEWRGGLGDKL